MSERIHETMRARTIAGKTIPITTKDEPSEMVCSNDENVRGGAGSRVSHSILVIEATSLMTIVMGIETVVTEIIVRDTGEIRETRGVGTGLRGETERGC